MTRRRGIVVAVIVAVVIAAGGLAAFLLTRSASPEDVTLEYFRALESGQQDSVTAAGIEVSPDTLAMFAAADDHVSDARVLTSVTDGTTADVTVAYVLDGDAQESVLSLTQDGVSWSLDTATALGTVSATTDTGGVGVGDGTTIMTAGSTPALPAVYDLVAAPVAVLDADERVVVLPGQEATATLVPELRPEAADVAQQRVDEHLTDCVTPAAIVPDSCGIRIPWAADLARVDEIRYRIDEMPTVTLDTVSFRADGGVLVATVTGTDHEGTAASKTYRTTDWSVRGDVSFTADDIELSVW
ncbi:MAG: hypothetical protein ACQEW8_08505 [Actinomycetota bacterium]